MLTKEIIINGQTVKGHEIQLKNAKFISIIAKNGYIMCGYLNMDTANKFSDCAVIIKGVNSIDEMLTKEVFSISKTSDAIGVKPGMTGLDAIKLML